MTDQLFPRPARRMRQPSKDALRDQLALAADEIVRLRTVIDRIRRRRWWRRLFRRTP